MSLRTDILTLFPVSKVQSGYVKIRCPYHKDGQEKHPSMSILVEDKGKLKAGYAKCFACGWTGTFTDIARDMGFQYVPAQGEPELRPVLEQPLNLNKPIYKTEIPYKFSIYLQNRGIDAETQELFRVREEPTEQKVYMPVFSKEGRFLYSNARSTKQKMFFIQENTVKHLAGLELIDMTRPIAICESQIDAMTFYSAGFCRAVATLGTGTEQLRHLKDAIGPFFIAFDSDEHGCKAADHAIAMLGAYRCIRINFGDYNDANNLWQQLNYDSNLFTEYIEQHSGRPL